MTPIESIYEIKAAVVHLQRYLNNKSPVVVHRARERYEQWVARFFRENINVVEPEKRIMCLDDVDYFLSLLEETIEYYQMYDQ